MNILKHFHHSINTDDSSIGTQPVIKARFRAAQLNSILAFTPMTMAANMLNAMFVWMASRHIEDNWILDIWVACMFIIAMLGLRGWRKSSTTMIASEKAIRRAVQHAVVLALVWACLPLFVWRTIPIEAQYVQAIVMAGMMGGGALALSALPAAAISYVSILASGSVVGLLQSDLPLIAFVLPLLLIYLAVMVFSCLRTSSDLEKRVAAEMLLTLKAEETRLIIRELERNIEFVGWSMDSEFRLSEPGTALCQEFNIALFRRTHPRMSSVFKRHIAKNAASRNAWHALCREILNQKAFAGHLLTTKRSGISERWVVSGAPVYCPSGRIDGWRGIAIRVSSILDQPSELQ
jgi:hypothetical protein